MATRCTAPRPDTSPRRRGGISRVGPGDVVSLDDGGTGTSPVNIVTRNADGSWSARMVNYNTIAVTSSATLRGGRMAMSGWRGYSVIGVVHAPSSAPVQPAPVQPTPVQPTPVQPTPGPADPVQPTPSSRPRSRRHRPADPIQLTPIQHTHPADAAAIPEWLRAAHRQLVGRAAVAGHVLVRDSDLKRLGPRRRTLCRRARSAGADHFRRRTSTARPDRELAHAATT